MSWDDIGDEESLPVPAVITETNEFPAHWSCISDAQKKFLEAWRLAGFHRAAALRAIDINGSTEFRWRANEHYAFCKMVLEKIGAHEAQSKTHQVVALERLADKLEDGKLVMWQGMPVRDPTDPAGIRLLRESEAGAAAKVRETQLRVGGHLREKDESKVPFNGPALLIQIMAPDGKVQVAQVNNGIEVHPPTPDFLEIGDGDT